jgi:XRE family aerobic/anaerobic benzoate catabolism transcriptional regulator
MTRERGTGAPSAFDRADPGFYEALGRAIKVARTQQGVSRKELAEGAGVSYAYLSDIETGRGRPSSKALLAVAGALGRTPSELLQEAELYGALHDMASEPEDLRAVGSPAPEGDSARSWFHVSASAAAPSPAAAARPRVPTREQLQRLARSRLAGRAETAREELRSLVDGLSDEDVGMVLELARRLLQPRA